MVGFAAQNQAIRKLHCMSWHLGAHLVLLQLLLALGCRLLLQLALQVQLAGTDLGFMQPGLPKDTQQELQWWVISLPTMLQSSEMHCILFHAIGQVVV